MSLCCVLVIFRKGVGLYLFSQGVHDTLVHFYIVLILMGIGVDVGVRVSVYFFRGKLIIVVDEAHHISVSIRDKFVISINLSPY